MEKVSGYKLQIRRIEKLEDSYFLTFDPSATLKQKGGNRTEKT